MPKSMSGIIIIHINCWGKKNPHSSLLGNCYRVAPKGHMLYMEPIFSDGQARGSSLPRPS